MKVSPVLYNLLKELRAGRFRPRAIRRFTKDGIRHAMDLAWSLRDLRRSFYAVSVVMLAVLAAIGVVLALILPGGVGTGTWVAQGLLFIFVFGLTLLQLGLVRAETSGEVYDRFVLPNVLTLLRLLVIPYLLITISVSVELAPGSPDGLLASRIAMGLVFFAVSTDVLDGTLSRHLGLTSDFGRIYDPVVDAAFHSTLAVSLFANGLVGTAYLVVVLVRYLLPPLAVSFLYLFREPFQVKSTIMGKLSSLILSSFLTLYMALLAFDLSSGAFHDFVTRILEPACVVTCFATIVFFFGRGVRILKKTKKGPKSPTVENRS
ncbi:MAG: CDP-alcohol phosphatidyltransferase family protein [Deltaproteobacteria bacterium]|nr:CDP-alcohol phosphatidyltransferase family protein [Deltaproteobacteria bacterium]